MVIRLVKMTFKPGEADRFLELFEDWRHRIRAFPGCRHLDLWRDQQDPRVFFTHSHWDAASDLEAYRRSDVFSEVWPVVKALFDAPAEAWTVERMQHMP